MAELFLTDEDVQDLKNLKRHHDEEILDETEFKASKVVVVEAAKRRRLSPVEPQPAPAHQHAATSPAPTIVSDTESTAPPSTTAQVPHCEYCDIAFGGGLHTPLPQQQQQKQQHTRADELGVFLRV